MIDCCCQGMIESEFSKVRGIIGECGAVYIGNMNECEGFFIDQPCDFRNPSPSACLGCCLIEPNQKSNKQCKKQTVRMR